MPRFALPPTVWRDYLAFGMANRPDSPPPTLADVGRLAGVSASAASLALRNDPRITAPTKERVLKAAEKLGYVPDPLLSALVARRSRNHPPQTLANLAALLDSGWKAQSMDWLQPLFDGLHQASQRLGYSMEILSIQDTLHSTLHPDQLLQSRGIRGLIILPTTASDLSLELDWNRYSIVSIGTRLEKYRFHRTSTNLFAAMTMVCTHLYERGYRRLGVAHARVFEERTNYEWIGSLCKEAFLRTGLTVVPPYLPEKQEEKSFHAWMRRQKPDCILSNSPREILQFLQAGGWNVPGEVGVAALSRNVPGMAHFSGVSQHLDLTAAAAVKLVHQLITSGETGLPEQLMEIRITSHWHEGDTTRPLKS